MGELVLGDDGLLVEEVGTWAKEKHDLLRKYVGISHGVRTKFLGHRKGGATYIDLFSGPGRARVRKTGEFIDGSCLAAWKESVRVGSPFSRVIVADSDEERLSLAEARLRSAGAPVTVVQGRAENTALHIVEGVNPYGLHFAFLDPYNLGAFDFNVIRALADLDRIDMLIHVSRMDLQRNLGFNIGAQQSAFDAFAPGWRQAVNLGQSQPKIRRDVFEYWRSLVAETGVAASIDMRLISGSKNQPLYWLLLAAKHDLAHKFWKAASATGQASLF